MHNIEDEHPIRAFVIETGNLDDGFEQACQHIGKIEALNADLLEACEFVLQELSSMTTGEFSHGYDRQARDMLKQAIEKAK